MSTVVTRPMSKIEIDEALVLLSRDPEYFVMVECLAYIQAAITDLEHTHHKPGKRWTVESVVRCVPRIVKSATDDSEFKALIYEIWYEQVDNFTMQELARFCQ